MKRNLMNELKEGICAFSTIQRYKKESEEIEQILGKALGYPWFKDDQDNFPNATEADGVAVGDHTAWSLAMEAADKIKHLEKQLNESVSIAEMLAATINQYKQHDDVQRSMISRLQNECDELSNELDLHQARVHNLSLEEWRKFKQS